MDCFEIYKMDFRPCQPLSEEDQEFHRIFRAWQDCQDGRANVWEWAADFERVGLPAITK
jgi:hypothetical protein